MAPAACVLLDRTVFFRDHPLEPEPPVGGRAAAAAAAGVVGSTTAAASSDSDPLRPETREENIGQYLRAMKPDLRVFDPPKVSCLTLVRPLSSNQPNYGRHLASGLVAAASDNLVVIYAGEYRPAASYHGWYLLVDAASSSLSTIPGIPYMECSSSTSGGIGTVVMARQGGGSFRSEWGYKEGNLPAQVVYPLTVYKSFSVQSRNLLCWADLVHGLLLCDLGRYEVDSSDLGMSFVPLPDSCPLSKKWRSNPRDIRTMACVDGTIKFLTIDGVREGRPISLITYTLHLDGPSSPTWTQDTVLRLDDLWADDTFISLGLPQITPLFPNLSTQEHDVVYLCIPGDVDLVEGCRVTRVKAMLSVDTRKTRVISADQENCPETLLRSRFLISFNASHQGSKYHQLMKKVRQHDEIYLS
uniref:DUF1618 domain-containing protein n=1 Tax=Leersia perrieri TaxID=77586 RepID=A0A0D9XD10_9ORYZ